jgi:hypothetical protein
MPLNGFWEVKKMNEQNEKNMSEAWINTTLISCDPESVFYRGYQAALAQGEQECKQLQYELERVTELGRVQLGRAIKAESELAEYKDAKPVGIVRMSNPPDGNPKPVPKWILSEDQSHLKDGDLLYAHPDNAKEE